MSSAVGSATLMTSAPPAMSAELSLNAMLNIRPASGGRAPAASQPLAPTSRPLSAGDALLNATQRQSSMPSNANLSARYSPHLLNSGNVHGNSADVLDNLT